MDDTQLEDEEEEAVEEAENLTITSDLKKSKRRL